MLTLSDSNDSDGTRHSRVAAHTGPSQCSRTCPGHDDSTLDAHRIRRSYAARAAPPGHGAAHWQSGQASGLLMAQPLAATGNPAPEGGRLRIDGAGVFQVRVADGPDTNWRGKTQGPSPADRWQ